MFICARRGLDALLDDWEVRRVLGLDQCGDISVALCELGDEVRLRGCLERHVQLSFCLTDDEHVPLGELGVLGELYVVDADRLPGGEGIGELPEFIEAELPGLDEAEFDRDSCDAKDGSEARPEGDLEVGLVGVSDGLRLVLDSDSDLGYVAEFERIREFRRLGDG